jgi:hypothetical protein
MENLYRLEIESLNLGADVRAVGLELIEPGTREPVTGSAAAGIWAALMPALAGDQPWAIDFFAHLERVREFCRQRAIAFREPNAHALVIPQPERAQLQPLFERCSGLPRLRCFRWRSADARPARGMPLRKLPSGRNWMPTKRNWSIPITGRPMWRAR